MWPGNNVNFVRVFVLQRQTGEHMGARAKPQTACMLCAEDKDKELHLIINLNK